MPGYPDGFAFTLDTPSYDPHPAVAEFMQSELAKIGVTVEINTDHRRRVVHEGVPGPRLRRRRCRST